MIHAFLKEELKAMLRFHKRVLLAILKALGACLRYGLWLLPWIFFAATVWKPLASGWEVLTRDPPSSQAMPFYPLFYGGMAESKKSMDLETIQNKIDSGMRTVERISRQLKQK
ncbi:MAG: hypothetical protein V1882_11045 [Candidatus Omnitrophota bacterium]